MRDHTETAQIIQFADATRPKRRPVAHHTPSVAKNEEGITETGKNFRLRKQRRDRWLEADAIREYWRTSMKMDSAIFRVQNHGLPEGELHPEFNPQDHWRLLAKYRAAITAQLLTPAPTAREIEWKRAVFKHGDHKHTDVKPERIERAIADDVEYLRTHPTRRSGKQGMDPKKLEERREWKTAFRARVTLYAEQNGIDKSELGWLGRIKHQDLAAFADRYELRYEWLLEGIGTEGRETPTN
jgi:hypothetical protein